LTRFGYAALGVVYAALGVVAVRIALAGARDRVRGFPAAFRFLIGQEHGSVIVTCIAVGLSAFVLARLVDASDSRWSVLGRILAFLDAIAHAGLVWMAIALLLRLKRGPTFPRSTLAWLLAQPWGVTGLEMAAGIVIVIGLIQLWQALSGRLRSRLIRRRSLGPVVPVAIQVGRFGYAVRGVVTLIIGWFLLRTARSVDSRKFHEIGGALDVIGAVRFGPVLLGIAGIGLVAYGAYLVFLGFFRRPN
jgi:hypothetical protein